MRFVLFLLVLSLSGCGGGGYTPTTYVGSSPWSGFNEQDLLDSKNIKPTTMDIYRQTPLHYAAERGYIDYIQEAIKQGADVNKKDQWGYTPVMRAAENARTEAFILLFENGADIEIKNNNAQSATDLVLASKDQKMIELISGLDDDGKIDKGVIEKFNKRIYGEKEKREQARQLVALKIKQARERDEKAARIIKEKQEKAIRQARLEKEQKRKKIINSQACRLVEKNWIYKGKACKGKLANGKGIAIRISEEFDPDGMKYEGKFKNGERINGEISLNGKPLYDGAMKNGRPHGKGVCYYNDEPEECKYYKGKRIDTLYKQRIEFAKQREELAAMKEKMAQMQAQQNEQSQRYYSNQPNQGSGSSVIMDTVKRKATERVVDSIFDRLF